MVDDFAPTGRHGDDGLESVAERLFRAVGNQQGRSRMVGNGRLQQSHPPRALLLAGAIGAAERTELEQRCERAFQELVLLQARYHQAGDPAHFRVERLPIRKVLRLIE